MADSSGSGDGHQNLRLTPEEKRVYGQLFQAADTEGVGVVTGDVAVKFFEKSRLDPRVLGEIWQIADTENRGFLTPAGFGVVLRLIGHVQSGRDPVPELAFRPGPLPRFDGFSKATPPPPAVGVQAQPTGGPIRVPPLTLEKVTEFSTLFEGLGAQNGILPGPQAKQVFERAKLPYDVLERIWSLADTQQKGALGLPEFVIAMHFITLYKSGALRVLPAVLPPGLYDAASRFVQPHSPRGSIPSQRPPDTSRLPSVPAQFSGNSSHGLPRPTGTSGVAPLSAQGTGTDWDISPKDKAQFDGIFATVDRTNKGYITGVEAVRFFGNSRLSADVLAQIWDLACINGNGQLNRDEFAVAMYLIRQQRGARDGSNALPAVLPPSLVPPTMRRQRAPASQSVYPAYDTPNTLSKSAADDLFGLDALSPPSPSQAQSTGSSSLYNVTRPNPSVLQEPPPTSPQQGQQNSIFKPFQPSSSFGQTIVTPHLTGASGASSPSQPRQPIPPRASAVEDLLGDNDPEVSKKLTAETTEVANLSNQISSLSKQTQDMNAKKLAAETEIGAAASQKRELEVKLAQLRTGYEREVQDVRALEEQLNNCRNEIKKLLRDVAMTEGSYEDIKNQHRQAMAALEADQRENAALKEKVRTLNSEMDLLRPQLEKLKLDARQQKGLVAINKKQLLASENERDRLKMEIEEESKAVESRTVNESQKSSQQTLPGSGGPTVPTASQSTNPFFRNLPSPNSDNAISPGPYSPEAAAPLHVSQGSFEDVFGPSFSSQAASVPPPSTSFRTVSESKGATSSAATIDPPMQNSGGVHQGRSLSQSQGHQLFAEPSSNTGSIQGSPPYASSTMAPGSLFMSTQQQGAHANAEQEAGADRGSPFGEGPDGNGDNPSDKGNARHNKDDEIQSAATSETVSRVPTASTDAKASDSNNAQAEGQSSPSTSFSPLKFFRDIMPSAFPGGSPPQESSGVGNIANEGSEDKGKSSVVGSNIVPDASITKTDEPAKPVSANDDFAAAFADFDTAKPSLGLQSNGLPSTSKPEQRAFPPVPSRIDHEFPPIQELDNDEDSDSSSERRFDDDFTPVSPPGGQNNSSPVHSGGNQPSTGLYDAPSPGVPAPRPTLLQALPSERGQPPTPGAEVSPPTYTQSTGTDLGGQHSGKDPNHFPPEFTGLLPSRDDPTQAATSQDRTASSNSTESQNASVVSLNATGGTPLAPSIMQPSSPALGTSQSTTPSEGYQLAPSYLRSEKEQPTPETQGFQAPTMAPPEDEFDREFADLADAKESDDIDHSGFGLGIPLSAPELGNLADFNPVFDSPGPVHGSGGIGTPAFG